MAELTTDPTDPRLGRGADDKPVSQNAAYLVLPNEERAKGFVRPVRSSYVHVGIEGPKYPLADLSEEDKERHKQWNYVKFEKYPDDHHFYGSYWTQERLDKVNKGCGTLTSMPQAIAETYARDPHFYGSTYCCGCMRHIAVAEFVWEGTNERVGS